MRLVREHLSEGTPIIGQLLYAEVNADELNDNAVVRQAANATAATDGNTGKYCFTEVEFTEVELLLEQPDPFVRRPA